MVSYQYTVVLHVARHIRYPDNPFLFALRCLTERAAVQVNIDFEDEADMVEKMRIGIALQPVATALFANSPFRDGGDTGVPVDALPRPAARVPSVGATCAESTWLLFMSACMRVCPATLATSRCPTSVLPVTEGRLQPMRSWKGSVAGGEALCG